MLKILASEFSQISECNVECVKNLSYIYLCTINLEIFMYPFFGLLNFIIFVVPVHIRIIFRCKKKFRVFKFRHWVDRRKYYDA